MPSLFKKWDPASARLATLFSRHALGAQAVCNERTWTVSPPGGSPERHGVVVRGKAGTAEFTCWLDAPDWHVPVSDMLGLSPELIPELPEPVIRAALAAFAEGFLEILEQGLGQPVTLSEVECKEAKPLFSACRFLLLRDDGMRLGGAWSIAGADEAWREAAMAALGKRPVSGMQLSDALPLVAEVVLATWRLSASVWPLNRGDVVLPPISVEQAKTRRSLVVGRAVRYSAHLEEGHLRVEGKTMTVNEASAEPTPDDVSPVSIDDVNVELTARVGRLTMTLAQLRSLGAGQVVEFDTPVETPAALCVGDQVVATGELVDVGGRVGVRIAKTVETPPEK